MSSSRERSTRSRTSGSRRAARDTVRVGVISDTHGLLRPEALAALKGSDLILHAGDIGASEILETLGRIAPVTAVRGNMDSGPWALSLPETATLELADIKLQLVHDVQRLFCDPALEGFSAVVAGHSHRPRNERQGGVLYFNPGGAGPRRFRLPITVGRLTISDGRVRGRVVRLIEDRD